MRSSPTLQGEKDEMVGKHLNFQGKQLGNFNQNNKQTPIVLIESSLSPPPAPRLSLMCALDAEGNVGFTPTRIILHIQD